MKIALCESRGPEVQASVLKDELPRTRDEVKVKATIRIWTETLASGQSCMRSMSAASAAHVTR